MDQHLLRCGGIRTGTGRLTAISFAAGAIASSLPAGPVVSSAFGFRQFRRLGASEGLAAWALVATLVFSALGLACSPRPASWWRSAKGSAFDLVGVIVAILAAAFARDGAAVPEASNLQVPQPRARRLPPAHRVPAPARRRPAAFVDRLELERVDFDVRDLFGVLAWCGRQLGSRLFPALSSPSSPSAPGSRGVGFLLAYGAGPSWRRTCRSPQVGSASSRGAL